jgi:two-component system, chemotaxis family, sensor kinase CheA
VPVADLAAVLGAAAPPLGPGDVAAVVAASAHRTAIACDRVVAEHETVVKSLGPLLGSVPGYLGAAILPDGRLALILDPAHLARGGGRTATATAPAPVAEAATPERTGAPRILVVDDQFTVRELQRSILAAAGYVVETASDGQEALDLLRRRGDIDLVITDIEMPQVDGLELTRRLRSGEEHASVPIVIVSSRGAEADRAAGAEAGADAYVVKGEFDQGTLLETVARLVDLR